jgi:hypothetical protein
MKAPVMFISHGGPMFAIEAGALGPSARADFPLGFIDCDTTLGDSLCWQHARRHCYKKRDSRLKSTLAHVGKVRWSTPKAKAISLSKTP